MHHRASWHGGQQPSSSQLKGIVSIQGGKEAGGKIAGHNYGLADGKGGRCARCLGATTRDGRLEP